MQAVVRGPADGHPGTGGGPAARPRPPMSPGARRVLTLSYLGALGTCAAVAVHAAVTGRALLVAVALLASAACSELFAVALLRDRDRRRAARSEAHAAAVPVLG